MRLCPNVPGQYAIQTALGGYQSINDLIVPGGRLYKQRELAYDMLTAIPGRELREAAKRRCTCSRSSTRRCIRSRTTSSSSLDLLLEERVLLVQGTGFNWPTPDHFRVVFLPNVDDLADSINRIARFLDGYRKRHYAQWRAQLPRRCSHPFPFNLYSKTHAAWNRSKLDCWASAR